MRDYDKMMQDGWIDRIVIEQEMHQERRAARRAFSLRKSQIEAYAQEQAEQLKRGYLAKLKTINDAKDEAILQEEQRLNACLLEIAKEDNYMRQCCRKLGINA